MLAEGRKEGGRRPGVVVEAMQYGNEGGKGAGAKGGGGEGAGLRGRAGRRTEGIASI